MKKAIIFSLALVLSSLSQASSLWDKVAERYPQWYPQLLEFSALYDLKDAPLKTAAELIYEDIQHGANEKRRQEGRENEQDNDPFIFELQQERLANVLLWAEIHTGDTSLRDVVNGKNNERANMLETIQLQCPTDQLSREHKYILSVIKTDFKLIPDYKVQFSLNTCLDMHKQALMRKHYFDDTEGAI